MNRDCSSKRGLMRPKAERRREKKDKGARMMRENNCPAKLSFKIKVKRKRFVDNTVLTTNISSINKFR